MKNKTILKYFFGGIMIAGYFGSLFTPRKGSESRTKLADKNDNFMDTIKKYPSNLCELLLRSKALKLEKINIENLIEMNKTSLI